MQIQIQNQNQIFLKKKPVGGSSTPSAPTDFTLTDQADVSNVTMQWTVGAGATSTEVWIATNGGAFAFFAAFPAPTNSTTDNTIYPDGTLIEYKVRSVNASGNSPFSVTRGALQNRDDSLSVTTPLVYPTVQVILGSYQMLNNAAVGSLSFPELLYAAHPLNVPPFVGIDVGGSSLTTLSFPKLQHLGQLETGGAHNLVTIQADDLATVDNFMGFNPIGSGANLSFPSLTNVLGAYIDCSNTHWGSISFPVLGSVNTDIAFNSASGVTSMDFHSLSAVGGVFSLQFGGATVFTALSLPALLGTGSTFIVNNSTSLQSISAPNLNQVSGDCSVTGCSALLTLNLSALQTVSGEFDIVNNAVLTSIDLSHLTASGTALLGNDFQVTTNPLLTSLLVPLLATVDQTIRITGTGLLTLSFPALHNFGEAMVIQNNPSMASISFGDMSGGFNDQWAVSLNAALVTVTMPNIIFPDNGINVDWSGNAMNAAAVNLVLARCRASGDTTNVIDTSGGTSAAPTGQGITDKAFLITAGNSVTTN